MNYNDWWLSNEAFNLANEQIKKKLKIEKENYREYSNIIKQQIIKKYNNIII